MLVVLPVPGGPCRQAAAAAAACQAGDWVGGLRRGKGARTARIMLGMLPSSAMTCSRATASTLPTMSVTTCGRYFSTCRGGGEAEEQIDWGDLPENATANERG